MGKTILVTNDDGIFSKGLDSLVRVASNFGRVVVVAPDKPQSGMGHAITIHNPLRLKKSQIFNEVEAYACSGTPVDCVKLGVYEILKKKPDLILSGINHGENSSTNVLYSGTMSAAIEGAMEGILSVGFSLCDYDPNADFTASEEIAQIILNKIFQDYFNHSFCLNVNIPNLSYNEIKGIKLCKQANAYWEDSFEKRKDQFGQDYFWLTGNFSNRDLREGTDLAALKEHYVSVVPTQFDLTAHNEIPILKFLEE